MRMHNPDPSDEPPKPPPRQYLRRMHQLQPLPSSDEPPEPPPERPPSGVPQTDNDTGNQPPINKDLTVADHHILIATKTIMAKRSGTDVSVLLDPTIERLRLNLAQCILLGIAIFLVLGGSAKLFAKDGKDGDEIFEACKTIFPPIGTLVIGYYFGGREK